jgi:hypothetical protein
MVQTTKSSYVSRMVVLRHMVICLLTLTLAIGTGWQSCVAMQETSSTGSLPNHADLAQGHEHHQHAMAANEAPNDRAQAEAIKGQPDSRQGCIKCCAACMLTSVIPVGPGSTPAQTVTHVTFASLIEQSRGRVVVVDPDIPKHIV